MRAFGVTAALLAALLLAAQPQAAKKKEEKKKEDAKWSVSEPPGEWTPITIDTRETTWSNVDVSPDGRTVVFDALGDIYTVPIEGGEAAALTDGIEWNFQPRYSPDGATIAFISDRGGANNLWIMDSDGTDPRAVTEEKEHLVHNPYWSPDGQFIVAKKDFTSTRSIAAGEIWLFHVGGGGGLPVTERPHGDRDQKTMAEPSLSVDGRYVYYSQDVTPGRVWQYNKDSTAGIFAIKRLDRRTGEIETYVEGPGGAIRPTPSPDGKYLAFVKRLPNMKSAIYLKDLESGREWAVHDDLDRDLQETFGSQGNTAAIAWTPDSGSIVFWAGGKIRRVDVATKKTSIIPVHLRATKKIQPALRLPVDVAPESIEVRMLRWAQVAPDGGTVLFQALGNLRVKNLESGQMRRLTDQEDHFELYPSWSRDGSRIVYTTWDDQDLGSVRVVPAGGGTGRTVTGSPGHYVEPSFSPDGKMIVYRKIAGGYLLSGEWSMEPGIYVMPAAGGEAKHVSRSGFNPRFGAENDRVYFSDNGEGNTLLLKSVNLTGDDERIHLKGDDVTEFSLSPDERWVAFTQQYDAYVAPFTATGRTVTIGSKTTSVPVKQVSRRSGEFLRWSGDSKTLHWAHAATLYSRDLKDAFSFLEGAPDELPEPVEEGIDLGFAVPADRPEGTLVLAGGRVVTMRDAREMKEVIDNGVVVIEGNRITAVGEKGKIPIPSDAVLIDVTGRTIVPGFLDVHAHGAQATEEIVPQQNWMQYSNLAFGVTTIHDPSNDTSSIFAAAELQRAGTIVAPRIFSTGRILYGAHLPGYTATIETLDDARFHVRRLRDSGAITVKSYQQPRREQRQMLLAAARELGVMVVPEGGGKFQNNMNMIVDGHTGIEHSLSIATAYEDVLQLWSSNAVGYTPTLVVAFGGLSGENWWYQNDDVWKNERLLRYTPRFVIEPRAIRRTMAPAGHYNHIRLAEFARRLVDRGGSVQIGAHGQREGLGSHWEMWMLQQGGFTPWEALRAATIDGARYLGFDGDLGSIEAGKLADLVVIDGNPLEDLRRSEHVVYTVLDGKVYEAATMNRIAPDRMEREPFFFEKEGGDTIHPEASTRIRALQGRFGWTH